MGKYEVHSFYCLNCGRKGIPLWRDKSHLHSKNHRKKLYCPFCNETVNHLEVSTIEQAEQFKIDFEKGVYKDEAAQSLSHVWNSGIGKKHLA